METKNEEKKSVKFNEVVQRQVYRSNSSILGQKMKNQKKACQKRRKAEKNRRVSEGDAASFTSSCPEDEDDSEAEEDLAAFKKNSEDFAKAMKKSSKFLDETNSDLIFSLEDCHCWEYKKCSFYNTDANVF